LEGRKSVRNLFLGFLKWKINRKWWFASIFIPLGLALASVIAHSLLGGSLDLRYVNVLPIIFLLLFVQSLTESGIGEEAGWRGFALPRLQKRYGALYASLIVGIVWALWHSPLFYVLQYSIREITVFIVMIICLSIVYTWIFNGSGGSLLLIAIIHNVGNTIDATLSTRGSVYGALLSEQALSNVFIPLLTIFTILLIFLTKGKLGLNQ
jgi:membrane protease YdiL (CAAX protease family)